MRLPSSMWWLCCLALLIAATAVRWDWSAIGEGDEVRLHEADTLRRLTRLQALDAAEAYPVREEKDGYPEGSVSHWTLPMDWVIRGLDGILGWTFPGAKRYEAGALWAGPLLAAASLLVMLLGCRRLLGPGPSLLAGFFYAFAYSVVNVSWLGNGDHQNLQHLLLLTAVLLGVLAMQEQRQGFVPLLSGVALGAAIWVSTESMLVFYGLAGVTFLQGWLRPDGDDPRFWTRHVQAAAGLLVVLLAGHLLEHESFAAFEIDQVSWFQIYQVGVFALFLLAGRFLGLAGWRRPAMAGALALAAGLLPIPVTELGAAIAQRIEAFATINVWLQNEVSEYNGLFVGSDLGFSLAPAVTRESWLVLLLPVFVAGVTLAKHLRPPTRVALVVLAVGMFGLEVWERKLGHLFAMLFPLVLVGGAQGIQARFLSRSFALPRRGIEVGFALLVVAAALTSVPPRRSDAMKKQGRMWFDMCRFLATRSPEREGSVLASWDRACLLMYHAGLPVVASGYHRNIRGILDGYRCFLAGPEEMSDVRELLQRRRVRFVVADFNRLFLCTAPILLGREPLARLGPGGALVFHPNARTTLFWRLRYGEKVPGFRLLYTGPVDPEGTSLYKIFEVTGQ